MSLGWRLAISLSLTRIAGECWIYKNWTIRFSKLDTPVFSETLDCALYRSSSNRVGKPRHGSLVTLFEVLLCSRFDRKVRQYILATPLGNRSSPTMTHYGMKIYNDNTIMPSIYVIMPSIYAPQAYNTNVVDRSHVVMPASSSHINVYNSYSSTDMSRWSNHNAYITEHVSNIHNWFMPSYSSTELASHCTL
jgi:hypothetical protein